MTPLEFLAAVLPATGNGSYCVAELSSKKKEHLYADTIEELTPTVEAWHNEGKDVYFALSSFTTPGKRTADNAQSIRSLFIDMDGYESKNAAGQALEKFMEATGLDAFGTPYIVISGGGLHVYWAFVEAVPVALWKPVAENLKRLCKQEGLAIDMTVTADAARVLRVPGTTNFKKKYATPRPVRLLNESAPVPFYEIATLIESKLTAPAYEARKNVIDLPGARPAASQNATGVKLFENSVTKFKNILNATKAGTGCAQLEHYVENAEEDGMEPLWRGWLSIAQKCDDGNKAAVWLSQLHPYPEERMHSKLREIKGPYPCIKFDSENPGICTGCQHWGKITNPLALGREYKVETEAKEIVVEADPVTTVDREEGEAGGIATILRPPAPRGFAYGTKGGIYAERVMEDAEGGKSKKQVMILPYDLFVVDLLNVHNEHTVHLKALRPDGVVDVVIPQKAVVSKDETVKSLANQNIIACFGQNNDKNLFDYVRACVEDASTSRQAIKVPDTYGWQADGTYVYAESIFAKHKVPMRIPMPGLENVVSSTKPAGTINRWRDFIGLLVAKKMWKHLAIVLAGAGSPLMRYTGLYGMTFHCASTESGTGKSLALEAAASVWGHPTRYRTGKATSPVAMQQRLGALQCMPLITDELTSKNRNDFEWFPAFLLDMTEGKGKERMEAGTNKERLNLTTWATNALMSSNTHAVDWLTAGRKHSSEGELRRVLEFLMEDVLSWEPHEVEIIQSLSSNYGVAGVMQVQYMVDHEEELRALTLDVVKKMYAEMNATNDERFWMAGIGVAIAAGILWSDKHAGIANVPLRPIINEFRKVVNYMRKSMQASARSFEDILNSYIAENYGKFVVIRKSSGGLLAELGSGESIDQSLTRSSVGGRVEHGEMAGFVDFFIEEQMLKAYCATMSFGYAAFCKQMSEADGFHVEYVRKDMTSKTKGPQMRVNAIKIRRKIEDFEVPIPGTLALAAA